MRTASTAVAIGSALVGVGVAVLACGSFDEATTGSTPDASSEASLDAGADPDTALGADGTAGLCPVLMTEDFPVVGAPAGWQTTARFGSVSAKSQLFAREPRSAPAALVSTVDLPDAGNAQAFVERVFPGRVTSVLVRYALLVGRHPNSMQPGCSIALMETGRAKTTRIYLNVYNAQLLLAQDDDTSPNTSVPIQLSMTDWNDVDLRLELSTGNQASASVAIHSPGVQGAPVVLPPFTVVHQVDSIAIRCGIWYADHVGTSEIAIDDVEVRACK